MPYSNPIQMMQDFMKFKQNFKGDPKMEVERMIREGKLSQQQLNQAQAKAVEFQNMMNTVGNVIRLP